MGNTPFGQCELVLVNILVRTLHCVDYASLVSALLNTTRIALTLIGIAGAHANVAHISSLHHVMKGLHLPPLQLLSSHYPKYIAYRLFNRGVVVEAMACANDPR